MATNKVILNGEVKIDLTNDTVNPEDVTAGVTFHGADGEIKIGENLDAKKLKSARILMGSKEFPDEEFYVPYLKNIYTYDQIPAFFRGELWNDDIYDIQNVKLHLPTAPEASLPDSYGNAGCLIYPLAELYFDEGIESWINIKLTNSNGLISTPQEQSSNSWYYWCLSDHFSTWNSDIKSFIKGQLIQRDTDTKELLDLTQVTSIAPYSLMPIGPCFYDKTLILDNIQYIYSCGCYGLPYVKLNEGLEQIGAYGLNNLNHEFYTIPSTVTYIGQGAFEYSSIELLELKSALPPIIENGYTDLIYISDSSVFFVPAGAKSAYVSATGWAKYGDMIYEVGKTSQLSLNGTNYNFIIGQTWGEWCNQHSEFNIQNIRKYYNEFSSRNVSTDEPISPKWTYNIQEV